MLQSVCGKPQVQMPKQISAKLDDAFLRRVNKVCEWEHSTHQQIVQAALEEKLKSYKKQLDDWEKAEEKIRRTLPASVLNDANESAKVAK
jgi:predicted transcriptional regulator